MSIPLTGVVYPLDTSGQSPSNKILNERHELISTTWSGFNLIIPKAAPFFDDSIPNGKLIHYPSGKELLKGKDWITGWMFQSASGEIGKFVSACIYLFDTQLKGHVEIPQYQCLGGEWQLDLDTLKAILAEKLLNPQRFYWEYVAKVPQIFRPLDHDEDIDSFSELGELLDELQGIAQAIKASSETGSLDIHIAQRNPHKTGPGDLTYPLDRILNWNPATLLEMTDPNALPADRYMTPPSTLQLINNTAVAQLLAFMALRNNPQKVTAHQTGTLTEDEINALIQSYLSGGTGALNAATLQGRDLAGVVNEVVLAIQPTLKESYDALFEQISTVLENVVATDTALFAGLSKAQWEQNINAMIDAKTHLAQFDSVEELLRPEWPDPTEAIPDIKDTEATTTLMASILMDTNVKRANTGLLTIVVDHVTYFFTIHALTRGVVAWSSGTPTAGYRFFLDQSGTSNELRLWMVGPPARVGATLVNSNETAVVMSDGRTIYSASSVVQPVFNSPVDVVIKQQASLADLGIVVTAQAALGARVTTAEKDIVDLKAYPIADMILVNGIVDVPGNDKVEYDLTALLNAKNSPYQFNISKAVVQVRIQNTNADSPNYESWINGETAISYGMRKDLTKAFVYNHTGSVVKAFVRVIVPKS